MFGFVTKNEALELGFTHHASYYGIPLWITDDEFPMVATKWEPLEHVMTLFHYIEGFMNTFSPMDEQGFLFKIGPPIK